MLAAIIAVGACGNRADDSNGPTGPSGSSTFAITVSSGTNPTFSWTTGVAPVIDFIVSETSGSQRYMWAFQDLRGRISPPVVYGRLPANAGNGFQCFPSSSPCANNPAPLQRGVSYTVSVFLQDGRDYRKAFVP